MERSGRSPCSWNHARSIPKAEAAFARDFLSGLMSHSIRLAAVAVFFLAMAAPAMGLVLHPDGQPDPNWPGRPDNNAVGRWGDNASLVAISPNYVVTTRHQGGGIGTIVEIGANTYTVVDVQTHPTADIRVAMLGDANLLHYVSLYEDADETGQNVVIGGFGKGRGTPLQTGGDQTYGYQWSGADNRTLRWGVNRVDTTTFNVRNGAYVSDMLQADFDDDGIGQHVEFEATSAEWDSGGGWFIKVGDSWKLAGMSAYVEHIGETWFRNSATGSPDPDWARGIRISRYADWINGAVPDPSTIFLPGDANIDNVVDISDLGILAANFGATSGAVWGTGDFNGDEAVDVSDLGILAGNYGAGSDGVFVPEPSLVLLLGAGAMGLVTKRRQQR